MIQCAELVAQTLMVGERAARAPANPLTQETQPQ